MLGENAIQHQPSVGTLLPSNGDIVIGQLESDGAITGVGTIQHADGGSYSGRLFRGKAHGSGVHCFSNGDLYVGEWQLGVKQGKGLCHFASTGDCFEGEFHHGERSGLGLYSWANGAKQLGQFVKGGISGPGVMQWQQGRVYFGDFEKEHRQGYGVCFYPNGDVYEGQFLRDLRHGYGRYTFVVEEEEGDIDLQRKVDSGLWREDEIVESIAGSEGLSTRISSISCDIQEAIVLANEQLLLAQQTSGEVAATIDAVTHTKRTALMTCDYAYNLSRRWNIEQGNDPLRVLASLMAATRSLPVDNTHAAADAAAANRRNNGRHRASSGFLSQESETNEDDDVETSESDSDNSDMVAVERSLPMSALRNHKPMMSALHHREPVVWDPLETPSVIEIDDESAIEDGVDLVDSQCISDNSVEVKAGNLLTRPRRLPPPPPQSNSQSNDIHIAKLIVIDAEDDFDTMSSVSQPNSNTPRSENDQLDFEFGQDNLSEVVGAFSDGGSDEDLEFRDNFDDESESGYKINWDTVSIEEGRNLPIQRPFFNGKVSKFRYQPLLQRTSIQMQSGGGQQRALDSVWQLIAKRNKQLTSPSHNTHHHRGQKQNDPQQLREDSKLMVPRSHLTLAEQIIWDVRTGPPSARLTPPRLGIDGKSNSQLNGSFSNGSLPPMVVNADKSLGYAFPPTTPPPPCQTLNMSPKLEPNTTEVATEFWTGKANENFAFRLGSESESAGSARDGEAFLTPPTASNLSWSRMSSDDSQINPSLSSSASAAYRKQIQQQQQQQQQQMSNQASTHSAMSNTMSKNSGLSPQMSTHNSMRSQMSSSALSNQMSTHSQMSNQASARSTRSNSMSNNSGSSSQMSAHNSLSSQMSSSALSNQMTHSQRSNQLSNASTMGNQMSNNGGSSPQMSCSALSTQMSTHSQMSNQLSNATMSNQMSPQLSFQSMMSHSSAQSLHAASISNVLAPPVPPPRVPQIPPPTLPSSTSLPSSNNNNNKVSGSQSSIDSTHHNIDSRSHATSHASARSDTSPSMTSATMASSIMLDPQLAMDPSYIPEVPRHSSASFSSSCSSFASPQSPRPPAVAPPRVPPSLPMQPSAAQGPGAPDIGSTTVTDGAAAADLQADRLSKFRYAASVPSETMSATEQRDQNGASFYSRNANSEPQKYEDEDGVGMDQTSKLRQMAELMRSLASDTDDSDLDQSHNMSQGRDAHQSSSLDSPLSIGLSSSASSTRRWSGNSSVLHTVRENPELSSDQTINNYSGDEGNGRFDGNSHIGRPRRSSSSSSNSSHISESSYEFSSDFASPRQGPIYSGIRNGAQNQNFWSFGDRATSRRHVPLPRPPSEPFPDGGDADVTNDVTGELLRSRRPGMHPPNAPLRPPFPPDRPPYPPTRPVYPPKRPPYPPSMRV